MLYSEDLQEYTGQITIEVQEAIEELRRYFCLETVKVLSIDDYWIAIPVNLHVSIPPNGSVGGIDIREIEPILIWFKLGNYPSVAPRVSSDRKDFPRHKLSHLYVLQSKDPGVKLCLVRGNLDEWFANKPLVTMLGLSEEWYFKAANGLLNEDGNEFDPMRLDSYSDYHAYRYSRMIEVVEEQKSFLPREPFACFITIGSEVLKDAHVRVIFKTDAYFPLIASEKVISIAKALESKKNANMFPFVSVLIWNPSDVTYSEYDTNIPTNYQELVKYFHRYDIDINPILENLIKTKIIWKETIPLIHAIKRPKKMIGFAGNYEFVNFRLYAEPGQKKVIGPQCEVKIMSHIEPFAQSIASTLSGETRNAKTLFVGAGSLGSKIIMHNARSGNASMGICDNDDFLEHNLARHTLLPIHVGRNKANALVDELNKMFEFTPDRSIEAFTAKVGLLSDSIFTNYKWLVDSTASLSVRNWLALKKFNSPINIAKCELANEGGIGLLYVEGENRNPRIDDLVNLAYFRALKYLAIEKWRRNDADREEKTLEIGLGCSSATAVVADDSISSHAAIFSKVLHHQKDRDIIKEKGLFYLQVIDKKGIPESYSRHEIIDPFSVHQCGVGSGWEVRLMGGLKEHLLLECKRFKPKETGGILIGICNYKTKTIHVYDIMNAPPNSKRTSVSFIRSNTGLKERVDQIKAITGGMIGYVGEWHTHPMQLEQLSERDKKTVDELLPINRKVPIPTLSLIVTNTDLLPYIFL
ncbi:ThiF family adenylyltransferase [Chitinophaga sp. LS1]|uniref:ThiF family adenylyltransferase n=1 Tax=Chitinophaga sp. LS1 TaxID=3051176 RepID=UPI002AAB2B93|nr:ThiF family adenylyltransferase [Chitinophaga sp. LS1]WPV65975.1 ThiF family adenylyltransferase [Chitinophaga sp. LS1]